MDDETSIQLVKNRFFLINLESVLFILFYLFILMSKYYYIRSFTFAGSGNWVTAYSGTSLNDPFILTGLNPTNAYDISVTTYDTGASTTAFYYASAHSYNSRPGEYTNKTYTDTGLSNFTIYQY